VNNNGEVFKTSTLSKRIGNLLDIPSKEVQQFDIQKLTEKSASYALDGQH
jgi:hypothetical protein